MPRRILPTRPARIALAAWPAAAEAGFAPLPDKPAYLLQNPAEGKVSDEPLAVASGDVNGDGRIDLVVPASEADDGSGKLHVFLGDGSGRFAQAAGSPYQTARRATRSRWPTGAATAPSTPSAPARSFPRPSSPTASRCSARASATAPSGHLTAWPPAATRAWASRSASSAATPAWTSRWRTASTPRGAAPAPGGRAGGERSRDLPGAPTCIRSGPGSTRARSRRGTSTATSGFDLATGNQNGTISVLLQQADGSFVAAPAFASGTTSLRSLVATDVDGDGITRPGRGGRHLARRGRGAARQRRRRLRGRARLAVRDRREQRPDRRGGGPRRGRATSTSPPPTTRTRAAWPCWPGTARAASRTPRARLRDRPSSSCRPASRWRTSTATPSRTSRPSTARTPRAWSSS